MSKDICEDCGCKGAHYCSGKPAVKGFDSSLWLSDDKDDSLCGLELTVEQKIWRAMNQKVKS